MKRREFLRRATAAVALPIFLPAATLGRDGATPPSDQIPMAAIGLGFAWSVGADNPHTRMLAVCDVWRARREDAKRYVDGRHGNTDCRAYNDFREVLARDDIDAVYIATPDHWHALVAIAAARAGKDIYCQKPMTHTIAEGKAVVEAVRRHGVVFQHGTQHRSEWAFAAARELVRGGYLGELKRIRLGFPSGAHLPPQPIQPVPDGFDYDMWLGPAPWAPFTSRRCFGPHSWYFISDYCVGYVSAWGVHHLDSGQQGHGTDHTGPIEVRSKAIFPTDGLYDTPIHYRVDYQFADGATMTGVDVLGDSWSWQSVVPLARVREIHGDAFGRHAFGVRFEGTEGSAFAWRGGRLDTDPPSLRQIVEHDAPRTVPFDGTGDHFQNWVDCIRTRHDPHAPVEIAHRSTTLGNLAAISMTLGRSLRWDPEREVFPDDDEANRLLSYPMRAPWSIS
ncbi:MAG: Gfo/Idh/MocA family oxidoreductase [Pirellulales bacterium]|nr:Gfo/Idh/MocA family oxidoreductase [Pirellulales bacterium]